MKCSRPAMMNSAIGMEWMPAAFVRRMSVSAIPDLSTFPTPAAAECTQRRRRPAASRSAVIPNPKYASASPIRASASRLAPCGPSPSELVGARTTATSHPRGASPRIRSPPSGVSAQFLEVAARSTTSRRGPSVKADPENEVAAHQLPRRHVELAGGSSELELERPILGVVVHPLVLDHEAVGSQRFLQRFGRGAEPGPDRCRHPAAQPSDVDLEAAQSGQHEGHQQPSPQTFDVEAPADGEADRCHHPDRRRRSESGDDPLALHDGAGAEKPHAAHHLGGDARRVTDSLALHHADAHGDVHEQRGPEADEDVGPEAGGLPRELALEADDAAQEDRERQLDQEVEAQDSRDLQDLGNVVLRRRDENGGLPPAVGYRMSRSRTSSCVVSGELSPYAMLRACASSASIAASSGSVGVANVRKTVLPHCSQLTAAGTSRVKNFSLPQVRQTSVTMPRGPSVAIASSCGWYEERSARCMRSQAPRPPRLIAR